MRRLPVLAILGIVAFMARHAVQATPPQHWVGVWATSPSEVRAQSPLYRNVTLREILHTTLGGSQVRIKLSNVFGDSPLDVRTVHVALRTSGAAIDPGTDHIVTFSHRPGLVVPPGAAIVSDSVPLTFPAGADLAVSIFLPQPSRASTIHWEGHQTSYISRPGNFTAAPALPVASTTLAWPFLSGVSTVASDTTGAVVALGDSITDGSGSTPDTNQRWPDVLASRLRERPGHPMAVLNAGIGGNRLLHEGSGDNGPLYGHSALARFDRDVLSQPGARAVIVLLGINDIGQPGKWAPAAEAVSAEDIIAGLTQIVERSHEHGLRVLGGTIAPYEGAAYYTPAGEAKRQAVNQWIRSGGTFDGVADFDAAVRDPDHPTRLKAAFDSGDHLHLNDAGYKAMGDAIDLSLLP